MANISRKQRKYIKDNAGKLSISEMAKELGLSERKTRQALVELGIGIEETAPEGEKVQFHSARWIIAVAVAATVITIAVYARSVNYPFVFDDHHAIVDNVPLRHIENVFNAFVDATIFSDQPGRKMYRPIVTASYVLNWVIFGDNMPGWHIPNMIIQIINGVLIFLLLDIFTSRRTIAALVALVFVSHPGATEAVVFLSSRSTLMAATFIMVSVYFFARWSLEKRRKMLVWSALTFGLGLLCKENTIMLVPLFPVVYWALTEADLDEHFQGRQLKAYAIMLAIALSFMALRTFAFGLKTAVLYRQGERSFGEQLITQAGVWWRYFGTMLWPIWMNVYREIDTSRSIWASGAALRFQPLLWILGWIAMAALVVLSRRNRMAFLGAVFAAVIIIPETVTALNLISADRRIYIPLIGMALIAASPFRRSNDSPPGREKAWMGLLAAVVALYIPLGYMRVGEWRTEKALFQSSLRHTQNAFVSWHGLAYVYAQNDEFDRSEYCLKKALEIKPNYGASLRLLGAILLKQRQPERAMPYLEKAVKVEPLAQRGWYNLGLGQLMLGDFEKAEKSLRKAIEQDKYYAEPFNNLGIIYDRQGRYKEAIEAFEQAAKRDPNNPQYRHNAEAIRKRLENMGNGSVPSP